MKKSDFIAQIADQLKSSRTEAEKTVDTVLAAIKNLLHQGDSFILQGFGTFGVKDRAERKARNPRTGESMVLPATKVAYWKVSGQLKASFK